MWNRHRRRTVQGVVALVLGALVLGACTGGDAGTMTLYSGRSEELVGPIIERFAETTDIAVETRYAGSPELAATIVEEGPGSPADAFYAQDPASLGTVAKAGLFMRLPDDILERVPERFRDRDGRWVGVTGRVRVIVYDPEQVPESELPQSIWDVLDPKWKGRVGVAPTNGSFVAFVAAMILTEGEDRTLDWLKGLAANDPVTFPNNSSQVAAADRGEIAMGLVNHYYLLRLQAEQGETRARNHFLPAGDAGSLVMPSGIGVLEEADARDEALELVRYLLSDEVQRTFVEETFEYPLVPGIEGPAGMPPLESIRTPDIDLSDLADVTDRATELIAEAGLI